MEKGTLSESRLIKLSLWAIGYALSMAVSNAYFSFFLTNIIYMRADDMGTILFLSRIISAVIVPFTSALLQNFSFPFLRRLGKYRTWIVITVPLYALFSVLTFLPLPGLPRFGMMAYYFSTYFIAYTLYSFPEACYRVMMLREGNAADTRNIASHRAVFSSSSVMLYSLTCMPLVYAIGGDNMGKGYMWTVMIFCLVFCVLCLVSGFAYRKGDYYPGDAEQANQLKLSLRQQWQVFTNRAFFVCFISDIFECFCHCFYDGTITYYFTYVIGDLAKVTLYLSVLNTVGIIAALFVGKIVERCGVRTSYLFTFIGMGGSLVGAFFFGQTLAGLYIFMILFRIAYGFTFCIDILAYGQAADYAYVTTGVDSRAWVMSMQSMPLKVGAALAAGVVGWSLEANGFDAHLAVQPEAVVLTIRMLTMLVPAAFIVVAFVLYAFVYPLKTTESVREIQKKVAELDGMEEYQQQKHFD